MENTNLESVIKELKTIDQAISDSIANSEEVKNGEITEEEAKASPTYIIYKQISDNTIKFFEDPEVANIFVSIGKQLGDEVSTKLVQLIGMGMTQSAYNAMIFHDDVIRSFIIKTFRGYSDKLIDALAQVTAQKEVIKLLNKKVSELEKSKIVEEVGANEITE